MPAATPKKYAFEDFTVGRQMEFGAYRVKREDILRFAAEFDPQPFHLDEVAAEGSLFKGHQHDEVVLDMEGRGMYGLREVAAPATPA